MTHSITIKSILALICLSHATAHATPVHVGDRTWRQVTDTVTIPYNQVASICGIDGDSTCSGTIRGIDFDGWTWASQADVGALFDSYAHTTLRSSPDYYTEFGATWAEEFFEDFQATAQSAQYIDLRETFGLTSTTISSGYPVVASIASQDDYLYTSKLYTTAQNVYAAYPWYIADDINGIGYWLFKETAVKPVPVPPSLLLLSSGLLGIRLFSIGKKA